MKTKNIKILICSLSMIMILCLSLFVACNKSEVNKRKSDFLPLIGTTWKLVGFGHVKRYSIESVEPSGKENYLLTFKADGSINGITSTNQAGGKFALSDIEGNLSIIEFTNFTEINELFDGRRYIEAMNKVSSYQISPKGLSLYYGKDTYLFFRSVEQ